MRLASIGLKSSILTQLILLIVAAMLLVNVVMVKFSERDLIQSRKQTGLLLIRAMEQNINNIIANNAGQISAVRSDERFGKDALQLLEAGGFYNVSIVDIDGDHLFGLNLYEGGSDINGNIVSAAREAMRMSSLTISYSGTVWGVIWLGSRDMNIAAPVRSEDRTIGGIAVSFSLSDVYELLRRSEKLILFYILLDTLILAVVGIYLFSRIVVRPIHKLLKMTDEYRDGYIIPSTLELPRNEIGNLSRSLSYMLKRLEDNKQELKDHISSLEKANTELKQAQGEIIRSEKLASVGRLAAGIAHEIGNPIGIILGYLDLIRKGNVMEDEKADFLNRVESEILRVKTIITQLLDYSRPSKSRQERISVHELIKITVDMLKPQPMMNNVGIVMGLKAEKDTVFADSSQIQQVFINIVMNAADVLAENETKGRGKELHISSSSSDSEIEIRFSDNGTGIEKDELAHIFDPFYTTKEPGRGTGLGLSVSYRIIEEQGGAIYAESIKGEGMTVVIRLPLCSDSDYGTGVN